MKQKVKISLYSLIVTLAALTIYAFVISIALQRNEMISFWIATTAMIAIVVGSLFYMPLSVTVDDRRLKVRRPLKSKIISLDDIEIVEQLSPTMNERRIFGSGGWCGYWGWFKENDLGKYFAYYGKSSDCIFLRLKNGKQYMIGCENPEKVIEIIRKKIPQSCES